MALILPPLRLKINGTECLFYVNVSLHDMHFGIPDITPFDKIHLVVNEGPQATEVLPREAIEKLKQAKIVAAESYENTKFYSGVIDEIGRLEGIRNKGDIIKIISKERELAFDKLMKEYRTAGRIAKGTILAQAVIAPLLWAEKWPVLESRRGFLRKIRNVGAGALVLNTLGFTGSWAKILEYKGYHDLGKQQVASPKDLDILYQKMRAAIKPEGEIEGRSAVIAQSAIDAVRKYYPNKKEHLNVLVNVGSAHALVRNYLENGTARGRMLGSYRKELIRKARIAVATSKAKHIFEKTAKPVREKKLPVHSRRQFLKHFIPK